MSFEPPVCANYGCTNRIPRDAWLWGAPPPRTCSPECALQLGLDSKPPPRLDLTRICARPGCGEVLKSEDTRSTYCSRRCAARDQMGNIIGPTFRIAPGDHWEKRAPQMTYRPGIRDQMIRQLYHEQVS